MSNNSDGQITLSLAIKKTLANIQAGLKQISDKLYVNVTGKLNKSKTRTQIKNDLNSLNTDVKVVGKLDKSATKRKIKADIKSLNDSASIDVKANINTKDLKSKLKSLKSKSSTVKVNADINGAKNLDKVSEGMESINKKSVSTIANINLVNRAINGLEQTARKMIKTSAEMNEKLTDTRMVTGKNYEEAEKLVHEYNNLAKELGSTTLEVLDASSEWLRQGKTEAETAELIKQSMILSKVGAMDSATATERLTSAMNGYKMAVSDVSGIVDKFTSVDMAAAVSADELAEALSHTASSAYLAGVDIDKIISYITVVEETTRKSASVVGESFKTIFARMGKVTNGDAVDDMGEDISKVEATLRGLGIELRKSVDEFKDFDVVLDEVGSKWSTFSSVKQREIATAFGGVYQSENFIALMNNYDKVSKYVDIAANSAGTAAEKFQAYEESVKAHANEFLAAAESLSMNAIPADFMNTIISAGTALVEFIDNIHLLQLTLNNIVAVGAVKGFSLMGTKIKDVTQNVKQLSTAFNILDNSNSILSTSEFEKLLSVTKGLSESQLRLVISSKTLTNQQRIAILTANGLTTEEAEQTIATLGLATAEGAATTATFSLSGAMKALKAAFLSNPIGILAVALTTLISLITMGVDKIKTMKEEARQAAIDSANAAADSSNEIIELTNNYLKLSEEVKTNATVKENLITTEDTLLSKLGLEGSRVDELVAKYGNLSDAIKAASVEKLQEDERDLRGGLTAKAETALEKAKPSGIADKGMNHLITTWSKDATEINHKALNALVDAGYISSGSFGSRGMELWLTDMDLTTIEGVISAHDQLGEMLDIVQTNAGSNNEVYKELYTRYNNCTESIQAYKDGISDLNKNLAQQYTMQGLIGKEVPKTQKEFDDYRNSVIESAKASGEFEGSAEDIANAIDSILASNSQFTDFMKKAESSETDISSIDAKIKAYNELTEKILNCTDAQEKNKLIAEQNALEKEIENIAKLTSQYDDLTAAYENWQKAQSSENEGSKYDTISQDLENIKKLYEDGLVGTDDFKAAVQLMSNQDLTNATVEQLKSAFEKSYPAMQKYFKDGDEGCKAFLNDVSKLNSEWAHINENGDWEINFNDEDVAEKLGISVGALQAIMKKLKEFGFDINLSTSIESLADLKSATEAANDKLKELGKTDIDFNVNSTNVNDLFTQIDSAKKIFDSFRNEDGTVDLSVEGAQEAKTILAALIMQKQQVTEPAIMQLKVNAETAKSEIETAAVLINDFRTKYRDLEVKIATGEDTSALQTEIQGIITELDKLPEDVKTSLGINTEEFNSAVETLKNTKVDVAAGVTLSQDSLEVIKSTVQSITPTMMVTAGLDATLIENYQASEHDASGTVTWDNDTTLVDKWIATPQKADGTVYWDDNTDNVQTKFSATGTIIWSNGAGARGTAFAQGNWGTSKSG
ncbi:MAG: phage tail tape measure protein, partial [Ruminococcaceae bacterium]|nr:phage tail tape measure protein [Oscillospiraceae bacterium]